MQTLKNEQDHDDDGDNEEEEEEMTVLDDHVGHQEEDTPHFDISPLEN